MRTRVGFHLVMAATLWLAACSGGEPETDPARRAPDRPPGISLARVGTIGDYPLEAARLVVDVTAEGKIAVDGREMGFAGLSGLLAERAGREREDGSLAVSKLHVVLRMDESLPWRLAQWLVQECAKPDVLVNRILLAVLPEEGSEEGTLAVFLPLDRGMPQGEGQARRPSGGPHQVVVTEDGPPVPPAALYHALRAAPDPGGAPASVEAGALVPVGAVISAVDAIHRAGVTSVTFHGAPPPGEGQGWNEVLAESREKPATPGLMLQGRRLETPEGGYAPMPPVARVQGGFAGTTSSRETLLDRDEEVKPEGLEEGPTEDSPVRDHK